MEVRQNGCMRNGSIGVQLLWKYEIWNYESMGERIWNYGMAELKYDNDVVYLHQMSLVEM